MKASEQIISGVGHLWKEESSTHGLPIIASIDRISAVLAARGVSARISWAGHSVHIGRSVALDPAKVEFVFHSERALRRISKTLRLLDFARAYFDGEIDIRGPITHAVDILDALSGTSDRRRTIPEALHEILSHALDKFIPSYARRFQSLEHYSRDPAAYELFLDNYMQYTCGHFPDGTEDIDRAQIAKFRLIESLYRRHRGSLSGRSHLDIGCGWGGLTAYFSREFETRSLGNTNCLVQSRYAQERFGSEIFYGDFNDLRAVGQQFDLITIVGMIEHLSPPRRETLLALVRTLLSPSGVCYVQCITKPPAWIGGDAYRLAQAEVFKGHFLDTEEAMTSRFERAGLHVLEKREDRHDYSLTTAKWVANVQKHQVRLEGLIGNRQYRIYLGYLAFASKLFSMEGRGSLMRYLLAKH